MKSDKKKRKLAARIEECVRALTDLGERSVRRPEALEAAANYVESALQRAGYETMRQTYRVRGVACSNIETVLSDGGTDRRHLLVGAHYDSAEGTPGADDNASAVALLLELAAVLRDERELPLRFVAFVNEEPPFFQTASMGSMKFAKRARERDEKIAGMVCLESLGVFLDEPRSQLLPKALPKEMLLLPETTDLTKGNFVAVVANEASRRLAGEFAAAMRCRMRGIPLACASMPEMELSDHLSFWAHGFPALMVTDTAMMRNRHYHLPSDTAEKLDYLTMTEVLRGLIGAVSSCGDELHYLPSDEERQLFSEEFEKKQAAKRPPPSRRFLP